MCALIKEILEYAKQNKATDLHLASGSVPRIRVEERIVSTSFERISPEDTMNIINEILSEEQKDILKERKFASLPVVMDGIGRMRMNVFAQRGSYSIIFRLLDRVMTPAEELGIPDVVMDLHKLKSGLVLICGGRKTGKSTTIAAILKKISETRECHIITIEDPIEYLYKHDKAIISQKEVGIDVKDFKDGIYSAMTQDPDVIMISFSGEPEVFSAALAAAENGHLVITTLKTHNTVKTVEYIAGMYPEERRNYVKMQLSNVLQAIVIQQLVPSIDGKGVKLAAEVMIANKAMRNLFLENKAHQIPSVIKASKSLGMITMEDSINELYLKGAISKETALSYKNRH